MSFRFHWPVFPPEELFRIRNELQTALNRGKRPSNICADISVVALDMGSIPPSLELLEIGELSTERFRGVLCLTYAGDASVTLHTKIQANALALHNGALDVHGSDSLASSPLIVPLEMHIRHVRIRGIFVLSMSVARGITLSFKNDPLESLAINSTFDNWPAIHGRVESEIEDKVAHFLRHVLPRFLHDNSHDRVSRVAHSLRFFAQSSASHLPSRAVSMEDCQMSGSLDELETEAIPMESICYCCKPGVICRTTSEWSCTDPLFPMNLFLKSSTRRSSLFAWLTAQIRGIVPLIDALWPWNSSSNSSYQSDSHHADRFWQKIQRPCAWKDYVLQKLAASDTDECLFAFKSKSLPVSVVHVPIATDSCRSLSSMSAMSGDDRRKRRWGDADVVAELKRTLRISCRHLQWKLFILRRQCQSSTPFFLMQRPRIGVLGRAHPH